MNPRYRIEPLSGNHDCTAFSSGSVVADGYFRGWALRGMQRRIATCFVAVGIQSGQVAGYYSLASTNVSLIGLSGGIAVAPVAWVVSLAVTRECQGSGLGGVLLGDAVLRASAKESGISAMMVDVADERAGRFYGHFGFRPIDSVDGRLWLPILR